MFIIVDMAAKICRAHSHKQSQNFLKRSDHNSTPPPMPKPVRMNSVVFPPG